MSEKKDDKIIGSVLVKVLSPDGKDIFSETYTNPSTVSLVATSTSTLTSYGIDVPEPYRHAMVAGLTAQEEANQTIATQEPRMESGWSLDFGLEIPRYEGALGKTEGGKFHFSFSKFTKKG